MNRAAAVPAFEEEIDLAYFIGIARDFADPSASAQFG